MAKSYAEAFDLEKILCVGCGTNCDLRYCNETDQYVCIDCAKAMEADVDDEPTRLELLQERNL